jgi:hypothetical protein
MINILFSGCSFVQGEGLDDEHNNINHFSNILANNLFNERYQIHNIGVRGYSNERIFLDTLHNLTKNQYDYAFVCWTSLARYVYWAGLELYECKVSLTPELIVNVEDYRKNSLFSKKLNEFNSEFLLLNHPHYYIRDLINYINILINVAKYRNTKLYFINNMLPWDDKYFNYMPDLVNPSILTNYTNELLNSKNRNDEQINELYHMMHSHYANNGGINKPNWLNLYQSFFNLMIDVGNDGIHPGINSHRMFAELLTNEFKKKIQNS